MVNGPFLVSATNINRTNSVDLNQPNNIRRNCYIQFLVLPEPKLRVLHGSSQPRLTEAVDEKGNSLLGGVNMNEGMQPAYSWIWNMQCYLTPPEEAGKKIARLKGTMRFTIQTRAESASIEDLAQKNVEKVVGGRRFIFKEMAQKDQFYIVKMTLYRGGWAMADWNSVYNCNIFRLSDGAGQFLQRTSTNPRGGGGDTMEIEVQFQKQNWNGVVTGAPVKLTWDVPVESKEITVPFDFADLPLP